MRKLLFLSAAVLLMAAGCNNKTVTTTDGQSADTAASTGQTNSSADTATTSPTDNSVKAFTVVGSNYAFSPSTLTVQKGDKVKITFQNSGGSHDFVLDGFNVKTAILGSGQSETVEFTADKTGQFEYYCSVANHRQMGMKGTLVVQ